MKNRYKKPEIKGNHELLHDAVRDVEEKIHKLNEKEWQKFKESLRENFLMVLGLQEMMQNMLIQTNEKKRY